MGRLAGSIGEVVFTLFTENYSRKSEIRTYFLEENRELKEERGGVFGERRRKAVGREGDLTIFATQTLTVFASQCHLKMLRQRFCRALGGVKQG